VDVSLSRLELKRAREIAPPGILMSARVPGAEEMKNRLAPRHSRLVAGAKAFDDTSTILTGRSFRSRII